MSTPDESEVRRWLGGLEVATAIPCPTWCERASHHPYLPEDHARPGERLWREHHRSFELAGCAVEFSQVEQAVGSGGPMVRQGVVCGLFTEPGECEMTPQMLRDLSVMLGDVAEHLAGLLEPVQW